MASLPARGLSQLSCSRSPLKVVSGVSLGLARMVASTRDRPSIVLQGPLFGPLDAPANRAGRLPAMNGMDLHAPAPTRSPTSAAIKARLRIHLPARPVAPGAPATTGAGRQAWTGAPPADVPLRVVRESCRVSLLHPDRSLPGDWATFVRTSSLARASMPRFNLPPALARCRQGPLIRRSSRPIDSILDHLHGEQLPQLQNSLRSLRLQEQLVPGQRLFTGPRIGSMLRSEDRTCSYARTNRVQRLSNKGQSVEGVLAFSSSSSPLRTSSG
jgi:hypothetical protein